MERSIYIKQNRIISLGLAILLLFMTVSCDQSPATTSVTSDEMTTTPKVTTTQKTTTTANQNQTPGSITPPGNVRGDTLHLCAAERAVEKGWVNLNFLLDVNDEQRALFDGDPSTVYANWPEMLYWDGGIVAFTQDVRLCAVEITFENQYYYYYQQYRMGRITVVLGLNYGNYPISPSTVTYWGKKEVDGQIIIELPTTLYWEAKEGTASKPLSPGFDIMEMYNCNYSNPIVDIQFYGIVVETES